MATLLTALLTQDKDKDLPKISSVVTERRLTFAGHCYRAKQQAVSRLVLWNPGRRPVRSRKLTFPDTISRDTGIPQQDLPSAMADRNTWRSIVRNISAEAAGWWWWWRVQRILVVDDATDWPTHSLNLIKNQVSMTQSTNRMNTLNNVLREF